LQRLIQILFAAQKKNDGEERDKRRSGGNRSERLPAPGMGLQRSNGRYRLTERYNHSEKNTPWKQEGAGSSSRNGRTASVMGSSRRYGLQNGKSPGKGSDCDTARTDDAERSFILPRINTRSERRGKEQAVQEAMCLRGLRTSSTKKTFHEKRKTDSPY